MEQTELTPIALYDEAEAREEIRREAAECYLDSDKSLRNFTEDWGEKNYIIQVVAAVRPCPKAEVSVRLTSVPIP